MDANDEIALMAKDTGYEAPGGSGNPSGVVAGSGVKVRVRSTLGGQAKDGWVYLFRRSGGLSPGAGHKYVDYQFNLLSGDYKTTYKLEDGPNPENSTVSTPNYSVHFSDRWLKDQLRVKAGDATEVDILDRAKARLAAGNCGRSEDTFNDAEGAFIANKSGPVRAIRSYVGANSGPLVQREHLFYEGREDVRTFLRVHAVPGPLDYHDYSSAANGMTYKNDNNTGGVAIDGQPETPRRRGDHVGERRRARRAAFRSPTRWTATSRGWPWAPTTSTTARPVAASRPSAPATRRPSAPAGPTCWATCPNTDPRSTPSNRMNSTRTIYFEAPGKANGSARATQAASAFQTSVTSFP